LSKRNSNIIKVFILIAFIYALILWSIPFYRASISEKLVFDGCSVGSLNPIQTAYGPGYEIPLVQKNSPADKSGVKANDILLRINGISIDSFDKYREILSGSESGDILQYTFLRDNVLMNLDIQVSRYYHLIFFIFALFGFGFLINGFVVGYSRPGDSNSIVFFILGFAASLGFLLYGGVEFYIGTNKFLLYNYNIGLVLFFPAFFHFFLSFPLKYNFRHRRIIILSLYFATFLLVAILTFYENKIINFSTAIFYILSYSPFLFLLSGTYIFIKSYRKIKTNDNLKYILYGLIIGLIGFLYYFIVFTFFVANRYDTILLRLPSLLVLAIPLSIGYSLYKFKILDTELIIKKGLVFILISIFIVLTYLIVYYTIDTFISIDMGNYKQIILIIMLVVLILFFDMFNNKVKEFVDKKFFKTRYNFRKTILNFSQKLPKENNINDIISSAINELKISLRISNIYFWLDPSSGLYVNSEFILTSDESINESFQKIFSDSGKTILLNDTFIYTSELPKSFIETIKSLNIIISIPIFIKNKLIASLNLSPRDENASLPYSEKDIDLFKTLSHQMGLAIDNARLKIKENEKIKIEEELQIASNIQKGLFPKNFNLDKRLDIYGLNIPYQAVGGDFFDLIKIDEDRLLISIADVSLKGIPAAMYMAKLQSLIHLAANHFINPSDILKEINSWTYKKIERNSFISMTIAIFDLKNKTLSISRGGTCPAIKYSGSSAEILNSKGIALGVVDNKRFSEYLENIDIKFNKGDVFLFYTNGLTKISNDNSEQLSIDRINSVILNHTSLKSKDIVNNLMKEINSFKENSNQTDDLLLLIVKISADE